MNGKRDIYSNAPRPIGPTLKSDFPEVEEYVRLRGYGGLTQHTGILELEEKRIKTKKIFIADSSVFRVFERTFIQGNPDKALSEPNSIVITESLAKKIFGTTDAFGKSLTLQGNSPKLMKVTGVVTDDDRNSHVPMEAFISWVTFPYQFEMTQWYGAHTYTYILLNEHNDVASLSKKVPQFYAKHMKKTFDDANGKATLVFQPLTEIHLGPEYVWEPTAHGSKTNVIALNVVILLLLIFACINYVNLATARASERAAEVGIRKTLGSGKGLLVGQFLTESVMLALISALIAILMCLSLRGYFNQLADLHIGIMTMLKPVNLSYVVGLSLLIGLVAGIYPAFYLSSLESLKTIKGQFSSSSSGEFLRRLLVTTQYFIAAILIASILFVAQQTRYIKNKDIGFDKNNIVTIAIPPDTIVSRHMAPYIDEIKKSAHVTGVTKAAYSLDQEANQFTPTLENEDGTTFQTGADLITMDPDFVTAIGIQVIAGRNFSRDVKTDEQSSILINETAVKKFGWVKNPLGGKMIGGTDKDGKVTKLNVIGVVKDFNLGVSYAVVHPLIIFINDSGGSTLYVRITGKDESAATADLKAAWTKVFPGYGFEYEFLDETLSGLYNKEEKFLGLLTAFSFIIVFIASLGIISLISYTAEMKKKEIAIRKVLGSSPGGIVVLLSRKFGILLIVANAAALPATSYLIGLWLDNFAYRITPGAGPFLLSLFICLFFTAISVMYHTIIAVAENPVKALNYE